MSVEKRGKQWIARVRSVHGTTPTYRWPADGYHKAKAWHDDAIAAIQRGDPVPTPSTNPSKTTHNNHAWTLEQAWDWRYRLNWKGTPAESIYLNLYELALEFFGRNRQFQHIDLKDIKALTEHLQDRELKPSAVKKGLDLMSILWETAHTCRQAPPRPRPWPTVGITPESNSYLTNGELNRLFQSANFLRLDHLEDLMIVMLDTGMRIGECRKLKFSNLMGNNMHGTNPTRLNNRCIATSNRVIEALNRRHAENRFNLNTTLFPRNDSYYRARFNESKQLAGVEAKFDDFRYTYKCRMLQTGIPLTTIQKSLGYPFSCRAKNIKELDFRDIEEAFRKLRSSKFYYKKLYAKPDFLPDLEPSTSLEFIRNFMREHKRKH